MFLALSAYFKVLYVSSYEALDGDTAAIITVLQFPPSESCKSLVSFESRYGTCLRPSAKALMQLPVTQLKVGHVRLR